MATGIQQQLQNKGKEIQERLAAVATMLRRNVQKGIGSAVAGDGRTVGQPRARGRPQGAPRRASRPIAVGATTGTSRLAPSRRGAVIATDPARMLKRPIHGGRVRVVRRDAGTDPTAA